MRVLGVILARGGSTRFPDKNLATLGDKSLVEWAAVAAKDSKLLTDVVVSTDSAEIAAKLEPYNIPWIKRPDEISGPDGRIEDAIVHALAKMEAKTGQYDYVVALQAACPIRPPEAIDVMISMVSSKNLRGGVTVIKRTHWIWRSDQGRATTWWDPKLYPRSQDITADSLEEINSIMMVPRAEALKSLRGASPYLLLELPPWAAVDIDTPDDLLYAQQAYKAIDLEHYRPVFGWSLVVHPQLPKIRVPLDYGMGCNRIGVVLANGPHIDQLDDSFFRKLESHRYLSIGCKRIAASTRVKEANFYPDLHLVWDPPHPGEPLTESICQGLRRLSGHTWRLGSPESRMNYFPTDQILGADGEIGGSPHDVYMRSTTADAALNVLYRIGIREFYLYGVELNGLSHCMISPPEVYKESHDLSDGKMIDKFLKEWVYIKSQYSDCQIYCSSPDSRLISESIFEFRVHPGLLP